MLVKKEIHDKLPDSNKGNRIKETSELEQKSLNALMELIHEKDDEEYEPRPRYSMCFLVIVIIAFILCYVFGIA